MLKIETSTWGTNSVPFLVFLEIIFGPHRGSFAKAASVFVVSSAVSFRLISFYLDLLTDFYCRNRCWTRKGICGFCIRLSWRKCDATVWYDAKKKLHHRFLFSLYKLREIRIWVKRRKARKTKKMYKKRDPDPRFTDTLCSLGIICGAVQLYSWISGDRDDQRNFGL